MSYREVEQFGEAVKILRNRKKLTQEALAKMALVDTKYLREIEKGMHSVGLELALRLCKALEVNRFELFTLAWEREYFTFIEQWQKAQVNTRTMSNNEVKVVANNSKSLRNEKGIRAENLSKRLLGGDKCDIIKETFVKLQSYLQNSKVVMDVWKMNSRCSVVELSF